MYEHTTAHGAIIIDHCPANCIDLHVVIIGSMKLHRNPVPELLV